MPLATDTRPAVLTETTQQELQEFLGFRQLVRHLYADKLLLEPIQHLFWQLLHT